MKAAALTVWQPWASLIAHGLKLCELRTWAPPADLERLLIHAGKRSMEPGDVSGWTFAALERKTGRPDLPYGAIVAACEVEDAYRVLAAPRQAGGPCRAVSVFSGAEATLNTDPWGQWGPGTVAWRLMEVAPLAEPVPCRGRQGLWTPDGETLEAVRGQVDWRAA